MVTATLKSAMRAEFQKQWPYHRACSERIPAKDDQLQLNFRGWAREVHPHTHKVRPVVDLNGNYKVVDGFSFVPSFQPLSFMGRVDDMNLSGNFLVGVVLKEEELFSCLQTFAESSPARTLHLLAPIVSYAMKRVAGAEEDKGPEG